MSQVSPGFRIAALDDEATNLKRVCRFSREAGQLCCSLRLCEAAAGTSLEVPAQGVRLLRETRSRPSL
jgi:hypothetical protein